MKTNVRTHKRRTSSGKTTTVKGGYTDKNGKVIREPVVVVESFSSRKNFVESRKKVRGYLESRGKSWKQESMGYEHEDDLYYVDSKR